MPYLYTATGSVPRTLDAQSLSLDLINYARLKYGSRVVFGRNNISNFMKPSPGSSAWAELAQHAPMAGQLLWFSYQDPTYRNNNGVHIADAASLAGSLQKFASYKDSAGKPPCWAEIYERDVVALPAAIHSVAGLLK